MSEKKTPDEPITRREAADMMRAMLEVNRSVQMLAKSLYGDGTGKEAGHLAEWGRWFKGRSEAIDKAIVGVMKEFYPEVETDG